MGVMMFLGLRPGPQLFAEQLPLIQTLCVYLLIGCVVMILLGFVAAGTCYRLTRVPLAILVPCTIVASAIGAYSSRTELFDVGVMFAFGFLGFLLERARFPLSAVVLGLVLGPLAEQYFVQSLALTGWDFTILFTRPICIVLWVLIGLSVLASMALYRKSRRMDAAAAGGS